MITSFLYAYLMYPMDLIHHIPLANQLHTDFHIFPSCQEWNVQAGVVIGTRRRSVAIWK